jgi:hypothetical protein
MFLQGIKNRKFKTWETTRSEAKHMHASIKKKKEKRKKVRSYGTYYIKMLLSTNIHGIEAKNRARKSGERDIKLQFKASHESITRAIHPSKRIRTN